MGLFDELIRVAIGAAVGFFVAKALIKIVEVVAERITAANLARHARKALEKNKAETRELLESTIQVEVDKKKGNTLSLSALSNGKKLAEIELRANSIADDVYEGLRIPIPMS